MNISTETLNWLERCFERAVRYFRQKGLSEADAEDCAAEMCLRLLYALQRGAALSDGYYLAVLRGCYADFVAAHAEQSTCISLDNVKSTERWGKLIGVHRSALTSGAAVAFFRAF